MRKQVSRISLRGQRSYTTCLCFRSDYLHTTFLVITFVMLATVMAATGLDIKQNNENSLNYYKVDRYDIPKPQQYLLCFSIMRNWYRLVAPPKTEQGRDLRFVMTIRYLTTMIIVIGHVIIGFGFTPAINPEFVENVSVFECLLCRRPFLSIFPY